MPAIEVDGDAADYDPTDVDHKAIWCALYKQSPGDEGWQVQHVQYTNFFF